MNKHFSLKNIILLSTLLTFFSHCFCNNDKTNLSDIQNDSISIKQTSYNELTEEKDIFFQSFKECYKDLTHEQLFPNGSRWKDIDELLTVSWEEVEDLLKNNPEKVFLFSAKKGDEVVGFGVYTLETEDEIYEDQIAVKPEYWRLGIGTKLAFSILDKIPNLKKIKLVTRKLNILSCKFYEALGFEKSFYEHAGYDPNIYQGYEYIV